MKRLIILVCFVAGMFSVANAQLRINVNIGTQPVWGPTGYDHADYYYLPDINTYYSVTDRVYVYREGRNWRRSPNLPTQYRDFDLYRAHKVVINNDNRPYMNDQRYRQQYGSYRGKYDQTPIRDAKEEKYFENKDHPRHAEWDKNHNNRDNHNDNRDNRNNRNNRDNRDNHNDNHNDNQNDNHHGRKHG